MNTDKYKTQIQTDLETVTNELQGIAVYDEATGDWRPVPEGAADDADPNEAADTAEDSIERQGTVAALETRYRSIKRALDKFEAGTFGICEICGQPIEPERLEVNPAARTCIADQDRERELPL